MTALPDGVAKARRSNPKTASTLSAVVLPQISQPGWTPIEWSVHAMDAAADRLVAAPWSDPRAAYAAVGETLWWTCVTDELLKSAIGRRYVKARKAESANRLLLGLRYARNRLAHQGDVLEFVEPGPAADQDGDRAFWRWASLPTMGGGKGGGGEDCYRSRVAGYLVQRTLTEALTFLRSQAQLAPSGPIARSAYR